MLGASRWFGGTLVLRDLESVLADAFGVPAFQPEWETQLLAALGWTPCTFAQEVPMFPALLYLERPFPHRRHP